MKTINRKTAGLLPPLAIVFLCLSLALSTAACGSVPAPAQAPAPEADIPDWALNPPQSDTVIYGIGTAKQSSDSLSITMAESRARQSVALELGTLVQAMIQDFTEESGIPGDTRTLQFAETVNRQIVNMELKGARVIQRFKAGDGTWWVLVEYDKTAAAREAAAAITSAAAEYAEFRNWQAQGDLDRYLAAPTRPTVVGE
jgi:hypothetical protein